MNAVSQWWIGGLRTRKAKVAGSIPAGGSINWTNKPAVLMYNLKSRHSWMLCVAVIQKEVRVSL